MLLLSRNVKVNGNFWYYRSRYIELYLNMFMNYLKAVTYVFNCIDMLRHSPVEQVCVNTFVM